MNISERLKMLRDNAHQTQKQVAESIGMSVRGYQQYELAERKPIPEMIVALADHFDTSTDFILGRTDNSSPPAK